ncbi:hemerythrin domain-containing protein [Noviherbaspirillum sp.]|uniref:hemerythrin domain-containing protein n=1 Tax=Noviherbaspirillum sp. TaxID=1926288 RepID=UPI002FDFE047
MPRNATSKASTKSSAAKAAPKSTGKGAQDVLELLKEDHKKVNKMFEQFEKMKEKEDNDQEAKQLLVETACAELTIHAQLEEEIFYPALREAIDDEDMLDEAEVEHNTAKQLITELAAMQPGDELYDAKFTVLGEYVKHHVQEEEKEMFQKAKKAKIDLVAMAEQVMERKMELRDELGLDAEEDDEEEEHEAAPKKTTRKNVH